MKRWQVWASFLRPKYLRVIQRGQKDDDCCFMYVSGVDGNLVVSCNDDNLGKDGATRNVDEVMAVPDGVADGIVRTLNAR